MANTTCAFTSIDAVLAKANMGQLNITTVVSSCPDICTLAWGIGNPDLSGIGVNISYIFQAILTILFGPIFCLVYACNKAFTEYTNKKLEELQDAFLDISAQLNITVAIAAVVRYTQHPPFYELAFLRSLMTVQLLSLLSTAVTAGVFEERKGALRIAVIVFYGIMEFGFYLGIIGALLASKASWETLSELSEACKGYSHILPWLKYIPSSPKLSHTFKIGDASPDFSVKGVKFDAIIFGFIIAGAIALGIAGLILASLIRILVSKKALFIAPVSLGFAIGMAWEMVQMERTRNIMKEVTGADFEDNQWGFGQVIALLLWVPLCIQMFYYGIRMAFTPADPEPYAYKLTFVEKQTLVDADKKSYTNNEAPLLHDA